MRILVVQESDWLEKGPHQSHHLMERLVSRGHDVRVIDHEILWMDHARATTFSRRKVFADVHKVIENGGVTVYRPGIVALPVLDYCSLAVTHLVELRRQLREFNPDVIVGFGIINARIAIRLAESRNIPFVYYVIDELHRLVPQRKYRSFARQVERWNMMDARMVISINEMLKEYTIRMGARPENTTVIGAGVDLERYGQTSNRNEVRATYGFDKTDIVLFFMGWLYGFSGLEEIAQELAISQSPPPRIKMMVVGKGESWAALQEIRKRQGARDKIVMLDWQPYERIPSLISASDICILPAKNVDIMTNIVPIKLYEYMAAGKPVICTKLPGIIREFGDDNGLVYVGRPEETLERAHQLVASGNIGAEGMKARRYVERLDWRLVTDRFEQLLAGLI